jgi:hypothetical protein
MSADPSGKADAPIVPAESSSGSGEGAATALKALIKKRNMGEAPELPAPAAAPPTHPLP